MRLLQISLFLFSIADVSYAFLCPTNFKQINLGDSIAIVTSQCGAPNRQESKTIKNLNTPQEWNYFIPLPNNTNLNASNPGTFKTQIAFDKNGKVINIAVNGMSVGATTICGMNVQVGDEKQKVKSGCGEPSFINQPNIPEEKIPAVTITTYYYDTTPAMKLIFENDVLKSRD